MQHLLSQFDPRDIALAAFLFGVWFEGKRARGSLREHGRRLGALAARVNRTEAHLNLNPPALTVGSEQSNGE